MRIYRSSKRGKYECWLWMCLFMYIICTSIRKNERWK